MSWTSFGPVVDLAHVAFSHAENFDFYLGEFLNLVFLGFCVLNH